MTENSGLVNSEVASMLLGVSKNNLRQLVFRKKLVAQSRHKRRSQFLLQDVLSLQTDRGASVKIENTSAL